MLKSIRIYRPACFLGLAAVTLVACYEPLSEAELCHYLDPQCAQEDFDGDGIANANDHFPADPKCGATADCAPPDTQRGTFRIVNSIAFEDDAGTIRFPIARLFARSADGGDEQPMLATGFIAYGAAVEIPWAVGSYCLRAQDSVGEAYVTPCVAVSSGQVTEVQYRADNWVVTPDVGTVTVTNALGVTSLPEIYIFAGWSPTPGPNFAGDLPYEPGEYLRLPLIPDDYDVLAVSTSGQRYVRRGITITSGGSVTVDLVPADAEGNGP